MMLGAQKSDLMGLAWHERENINTKEVRVNNAKT
jgi:hypothetical protein